MRSGAYVEGDEPSTVDVGCSVGELEGDKPKVVVNVGLGVTVLSQEQL